MKIDVDIKENRILSIAPKLLDILLVDRTRTSDNEVVNILWSTDNYIHLGENYTEDSQITVESITGENGLVLRPRVNKSKEEQIYRSRDKAEVFTPAWICNCQNNLVDKEWFDGELYSLAEFTAKYMPRNKRSVSGLCQGRKYFSYNGVSLYKLKESFLGGKKY